MIPELTRAFGRTLDQTQWLSLDKLRIYQAPLLSKLLVHAKAHTDFYRDRFEFDPTSPEAIEEAWSALPIITRAEAVKNREHLLSRYEPPETGPALDGETSGSTSFPFRYRRSQIALVAAQALNERMYRWWKVDGAKSCSRISYDRQHNAVPPDGATLAGWHSAYPQASYHILSTVADVTAQVDWLMRRRSAYLAAYPHILKEIALAIKRAKGDIRFDLLFSFGAVVDQETRDICRSVFGAEIADTYGADEAGHFASQCPQCGEYHLSAEATRVEILRADGSPASEGEVGRVVATSFYNYSLPLIRYEVGDLAEAGSSKPRCRRGLPAIRRILGRYRNVFRFRDGTIRSPHPERFGLKETMALRQSQVIQIDYDRIEILWVGEGSDQSIDLPALEQRVRQVLGQKVDVTTRKVDALERSPSGKFEDCISLVPSSTSI